MTQQTDTRLAVLAVQLVTVLPLGHVLAAESASAGTSSPIVLAWNDECCPIWDPAWGGENVAALLDPNIGELVQKATAPRDDLYLRDTAKWVTVILKPELVPADLADHCTPLQSHILAAGSNLHINQIRKGSEAGRLDVDSYRKKEGGIDTSGIVVRYETNRFVILIVDCAWQITIVARDKVVSRSLERIDDRLQYVRDLMPQLFIPEVWQPDGTPASLFVPDQQSDSMYYVTLISSTARRLGRGVDAKLSKHFFSAALTLPPGPVVRAVFRKRIAQRMSVAYRPESRFERLCLFDTQGFDRRATIEAATSQPTTSPSTQKLEGPPLPTRRESPWGQSFINH